MDLETSLRTTATDLRNGSTVTRDAKWVDRLSAGRRLVLATMWTRLARGTMKLVAVTVLIVDDHAEFRASARALLEADGFEVVGDAAYGAEAVEAVALLRPQVVLLDVQLPGEDGIAVAERLAAAPDPPVIVLISSREASAYGPRLISGSARGFISKSNLSGEALASLLG